MLEVLLFLALAIPCSFAADNASAEAFDPNIQILDTVANVVKEDMLNLSNDSKAHLVATPHLFTVLITEPPLENPVQGVQDLWTEKIDPFLSPIPMADKPEIMKEIEVGYHHEQAGSSSTLLIACATIITMILFFGCIIMLGSICYIATLKYTFSTSSFSSSEERKIETHNVPFTEVETVDELSTLTDDSDHTVVGNRSGTPDTVIDMSEVTSDAAAPGDTSKGTSPVAFSPTASSAPLSPPTSPPPPLPM